MAMDPYSPCSCGSGKKAKFCCGDVQADIEQLQQMIAGGQYLAALKRVEDIEGKSPPRAYFIGIKVRLLRELGRAEEFKTAVARFRQGFPDNPIALAESAMLLAAEGDPVAAAGELHRSLAALTPLVVYPQMYEAMSVVAGRLLRSGHFRAGRALLELQTQLNEADPDPARMLTSLIASSAIPLLLKQEPALADSPADVPWKAEFDEALALAVQLRWAEAATRLTALAERTGDSPEVWQNLAILRGWLADQPGAAEALRKLATLNIPLEDAVEARATAMILEDDPFGDRVDSLWLSFPVQEADHLAAVFSTWKQALASREDAAAVGEDDVPPKATFWLLDRPAAETAEGLTLDALPRILGRALLFGRQTDRQARLEVTGVLAGDLESVRAMLAEVGRDQLIDDPEQEVVGRRSASFHLLQRLWPLPPGVTRPQVESLGEAHLEQALLEVWPRMPLGLLDGKSPEEVAGDPARQISLLAAIVLMEIWTRQAGERFDSNRLRAKLGLPTPGPIDVGDDDVLDVPLVRLARVEVDKLSDEMLRDGFTFAAAYGAVDAVKAFGREWVNRPDIGAEELRRTLGVLARVEEDHDRALEYITRGRQAAEAAGESSAGWDLLEINIRLVRGDGEELACLLRHVEREHIREPGVAEAFAGILVRLGILRPDGTLAQPLPEEEIPAASAEPGGLWTPDSVAPAGEKPKIWTPGMD
jgi:tetratricopeptide (TPR) repeat protein